ncbi:hypothetical protein M2175_003864 [Bradyrhizobium elkanii]|uniref:hypothetical protein n=1 Tax=Bradyrhizobium TaxID=374 RepID=UPI0021693FC3|nr:MULTISPECIES: hypothetical protein [Bradyrhizobium]MCS3928833.1 hypothetical protein [Bradyrhizobium elkanii]MCS3969387.1 hypothetical protein [Bradyrhizobium japonicum]
MGTVRPHTIYEEGRGSVHAATYVAHKSQCTLFRYLARLQGIPHCYFGKPELFGEQEDHRYAQPALVRKESVMHLSEWPGRAGELGAFASDLGVRMHFGQGKTTEDEPHPPAEMLLTWLTKGCASAQCCIRSRHIPPA